MPSFVNEMFFQLSPHKPDEEFLPPKGASWRHPKKKIEEMIADNRIWFGKDGKSRPVPKRFLSEVKQGVVISAWWDHTEAGHNDMAKKEMQSLFEGSSPFDTPKPTKLIHQMIQLAMSNGREIVLDFFAGSATTAHAVMQQNAKDGGNRSFIMVQIPEECDEKSNALKAGFSTIAEVSKERIRRAGKKIKAENPLAIQDLDVGFRVLKVDTSNMKDVYYAPDGVKQGDLLDHIENIREDRTSEDLLFQVLLDWGVDLSLPIAQEEIEGKTVFFVDGNALAACFDRDINEKLIKKLAARKPLRAVFRDAGFGSDSVKINVEQIFKLVSPSTELKAI